MLAVIQFPIADFRPFLSNGGGRSPVPTWPPRTSIPREFLRSFGPATSRHRGVDWAWTDERAFCRANRALRFERLPADSNGWHGQVRCAFRRLLSNGEAVTRMEVGLSLDNLLNDSFRWANWDYEVDAGDDPTFSAPDINPLELVEHISCLRTVVPFRDSSTGTHKVRPLSQQGRDLAKLFLYTTNGVEKETILERWYQMVGVGAPVMLIETRAHWNQKLPKEFVHIEPSKVGMVDLAYGRVSTPWGPISTWILGHGKARTSDIRNLRLCLLRLHAEQEVLDSVLDHVNTGVIPYIAGGECGDRLEAYLNKATHLIDRSYWAGIEQSAILQAFDAAESTEHRSARAELFMRLKGVRRQIRIKLERFEARELARTGRPLHFHDNATYINEVETMETKTINIGNNNTINAPITIADKIENSFNALKEDSVKPELAELMRNLLTQITQIAESDPEGTGDMATDAEVLSKEIARNTPRRKWYELSIEGIKDAAEALGEIGKPILETTSKLLPLLVSLFP